MKEWRNFGDVNFMEHGGCLVKKDGHSDSFHVISLTTEIYDYKGKYKKPMIVARCYIGNLSDWVSEDVNDFVGYSKNYKPQTLDEKMSYCVNLITYYGIHEFDPIFPEETGCGPYALGTVDKWIVGKMIAERFIKQQITQE